MLVEVAKLVEDARVKIEAEAWIADRPGPVNRSIIASPPGSPNQDCLMVAMSADCTELDSIRSNPIQSDLIIEEEKCFRSAPCPNCLSLCSR